jgi:hypothetical protein
MTEPARAWRSSRKHYGRRQSDQELYERRPQTRINMFSDLLSSM